VSANNIPYQAARSLAVLKKQKPFYFYPYRHVTTSSLANVLIIGAGTGNDVAVACPRGQARRRGRDRPGAAEDRPCASPEPPYQDPRVTTHIADGRALPAEHGRKIQPDRVRAA